VIVATRARFAEQYRFVREREGARGLSAEEYRALPFVSSSGRRPAEWRVRAETFRHLERFVLSRLERATVLDVGAGNGWLSHRLTASGHRAIALDWLADEADGLRARRHYFVRVPAVQADFDALPIGEGRVDLVVFNASLHYSADAAATLVGAGKVLAPGGTLAVMDSPMFDRDRDGQLMLADADERFASLGVSEPIRQGCGFLTFAMLDQAAGRLGLRGRFIRSLGPLGWRLRRQLARLRLGRAPARFGLWVAR
jgi:SAM-dependent methyltransferase